MNVECTSSKKTPFPKRIFHDPLHVHRNLVHVYDSRFYSASSRSPQPNYPLCITAVLYVRRAPPLLSLCLTLLSVT